MYYDLIIKYLKDGKVVAIKTDTVYGLICNALNKNATNKIYNLKKREIKKPLSIFLSDRNKIFDFIDEKCVDKQVSEIIDKYWPGALTIIFKKKNDLLNHITLDNDGIGIRIPNDNDLLYILNNIDFPLAQTSCNISGEDELLSFKSIKEKFGDEIDLIVDCGEIKKTMPSTIISVINSEIKILRVGDIKINV